MSVFKLYVFIDARCVYLGVFNDVEYLEVLSLRNNRISFIRPGLFNNMRRLVYLDLTENWISMVSFVVTFVKTGFNNFSFELLLPRVVKLAPRKYWDCPTMALSGTLNQ